MVHNFMPTFEQKAEALHWFPLFRTWFGLCGLCKLPWNDVVPTTNKETKEPAKVMEHVEWYARYFSAVTGRQTNPDDIIAMSEKVYNFQRIFNLKMGFGRREHDTIPYRAMGPVTVDEYESRQERYDGQLRDTYHVDIEGMETAEKVGILRALRENRYEELKDAVYKRRGWTRRASPPLRQCGGWVSTSRRSSKCLEKMGWSDGARGRKGAFLEGRDDRSRSAGGIRGLLPVYRSADQRQAHIGAELQRSEGAR